MNCFYLTPSTRYVFKCLLPHPSKGLFIWFFAFESYYFHQLISYAHPFFPPAYSLPLSVPYEPTLSIGPFTTL